MIINFENILEYLREKKLRKHLTTIRTIIIKVTTIFLTIKYKYIFSHVYAVTTP